jgi:hypothetical protein
VREAPAIQAWGDVTNVQKHVLGDGFLNTIHSLEMAENIQGLAPLEGSTHQKVEW